MFHAPFRALLHTQLRTLPRGAKRLWFLAASAGGGTWPCTPASRTKVNDVGPELKATVMYEE